MTLLVVLLIAVLIFVVMTYNGMIKLRNQAKEAWSDIDVQLKRRYNLIPNIVETVKGYASHEETVFTKVTEARANAINAGNIKEQGGAENMLAGALKSLFAVAENYPDLKANENFLQLQNELVDTEDKIQSARRFYNSVVRDFNTKIQQFPAKLVAQIFQFKEEDFFEVEDEEQKENVEVSFNKEGTHQSDDKEEKTEKPKDEGAEKPKEEAEDKPEEKDDHEDEKEEKENKPEEEEAKEEKAEKKKEAHDDDEKKAKGEKEESKEDKPEDEKEEGDEKKAKEEAEDKSEPKEEPEESEEEPKEEKKTEEDKSEPEEEVEDKPEDKPKEEEKEEAEETDEKPKEEATSDESGDEGKKDEAEHEADPGQSSMPLDDEDKEEDK